MRTALGRDPLCGAQDSSAWSSVARVRPPTWLNGPRPSVHGLPGGKKNFKGEEIMSKFINVGVGGTDEDKDVRKGTYKTLKRKQSILDKELTPALRKELKEKVEIFLKFY